jgi:hypothetical protein
LKYYEENKKIIFRAGKILTKQICDKRFVFRICKEFSKINLQTFEETFHQSETQMARPTKTCSVLRAKRNAQIKSKPMPTGMDQNAKRQEEDQLKLCYAIFFQRQIFFLLLS